MQDNLNRYYEYGREVRDRTTETQEIETEEEAEGVAGGRKE